MSALGLAALAVAQADLAAGVRGGQPGRFQSPEVSDRLATVGVDYPAPWCAAEVFHCFSAGLLTLEQGVEGAPVNRCPRTASAVHLWLNAPPECRTQLPAPGDVFVLKHPNGWSGHTGIVESVSPDGQTITTIEGDTSLSGSFTGDSMGRHEWRPATGKRGKLLGYLEF